MYLQGEKCFDSPCHNLWSEVTWALALGKAMHHSEGDTSEQNSLHHGIWDAG